MNNNKQNQKGFTMVELIIVVAIMAIIGALLVPAFGQMSAKARVTTDVSTVKTLKRTVDNYYADKGEYPNASSSPAVSNAVDLVAHLKAKGYLDAEPQLQTKDGAKIEYTAAGGKVQFDVTSCTDTIIKQVAKELEEASPGFIKGSGAVSPSASPSPTT